MEVANHSICIDVHGDVVFQEAVEVVSVAIESREMWVVSQRTH